MSGIEILGLAAGVIQIADADARVAIKLFAFSRKVKNADKNMQKISSELVAYGVALRELGRLLHDDRVADMGSQATIDAINDTVEECWQMFDNIDETLAEDVVTGGSGDIPLLR